jgi:hypothetical protein
VGADFAALIASLRMSRGGVTLDHFTTTIFDGKVAGRVQLDTTASPPAASLSAEIEGVDAARLAAFAGSAGVLTGRLAGHVSLRARGVTPETIFRSATGRATVVITDGTLPGLDLVSPVILAFGKPDPSKAAAPSREFSRLGGTFALAEGVLRSDDLAMSSRDVDLSGQGTLRVAGAVADVRADLLLSESLSAQAGRDLYRYARQGSRIVLPATVNGPLASPSVSLDVAAAAERAITNELEDQVRKALERLRKR